MKKGDYIVCINDKDLSYFKKNNIYQIEYINHYSSLKIKGYNSSFYSKDRFILLDKYLENIKLYI